MCGFSAIFSKYKITDIKIRIEKMTEAIIHRGPDAGKNQLITPNLAFGFRRLSIIDLDERANQPMVSHNGRYNIVFNGEIVNYLDLKKELDYPFITQSDTEVLLAGLEIKGIEWLLKNIQGMFAFIVYDAVDNTLIVVRDPMGIKPLFYTKQGDVFVCASEIKSILMSGLVEAPLFPDAIDEYLAYRYVRSPYTFFKNIYQVPCGHFLVISPELDINTYQYWNIPSLNFNETFNESEIIEELDEKLQTIVHQWMVSDVKVGCYLSGGVDSGILTALMSRESSHRIDTYTIGFKEKGFNEFYKAKIVAEKYHTYHHQFQIDNEEYFSQWDDLIWYKDAPLGVPNEIPLAIMTKLLSKDITVVLSGEGADELFGGYGRIFRSAFDFNHVDASKKQGNSFYQYFLEKYEYTPRQIRDSFLLVPKSLRIFFDEKSTQMFENFRQEEAIFRFFHSFHIQGLLQRVDAMTMQTSIEARPPFMDTRLIEFVYQSIPYKLKLHWKGNEEEITAQTLSAAEYSELLDTPKYILKKTAEHYIPQENVYSRKLGFPVPLMNWHDNLFQMASNKLRESDWLSYDILNDLLVKPIITEKSVQFVWMLLNVEKFINLYFGKSWKY